MNSITRMLLVWLLSIILMGTTDEASGGRIIKHPEVLKTIKAEDGDIIDCVDIYKQPSLNHPMLQNHKIQMKPDYDMKKEFEDSTVVAHLEQTWHESGSCPQGTIPIRRSTGKHNINAIKSPFSNYTFGRKTSTRNEDVTALSVRSPYTGTRAELHIWAPYVYPTEYSMSRIVIGSQANGVPPPFARFPDVAYLIQAGWIVAPALLGDSQPRLFVYWTKDNGRTTGCMNNLGCSGFIHTNKDIMLGGTWDHTSVYDGEQWYVTIAIRRDDVSPNWWIYVQDTPLGYFPPSLFDGYFYDGDVVAWGGAVHNTYPGGVHTSTQMGNGHFPDEGVSKAAMIGNILSYDHTGSYFKDPMLQQVLTAPNCYNFKDLDFIDNRPGYSILYGGPGGSNCS